MMRRRRVKQEVDNARLLHRVKLLQTRDLIPWAEQALYTIGRSLSEYGKHPDQTQCLDEAVMGAESLLVVVRELQQRWDDSLTVDRLSGV